MNKRKFGVDWSKTIAKIKEQNQGGGKKDFKDERIYYPQIKEDGTAQAIIRFLPPKDTDMPFVKVFSHSFRGPGGWFINDCPTTNGKECPVCKANSALWDTDPDTVRIRKRKVSYYSNILVIKDPQNPDNNGKVFLYRYGKKIYDKIMEKISPPEDGIDDPIMVFDCYDGANFRLKIKQVPVADKKMPNYDSSEFDSVSSIGTEAEIGKIMNQRFNLTEFLERVKPYEELAERLERVLGKDVVQPQTPAPVEDTSDNEETSNTEEDPVIGEGDGDEDEFFEKLSRDDD